jgi:signal transduction histidine kinase
MQQQARHLGQSLSGFEWHYRIVRPEGEILHIRSIGAPAGAPDAVVKRFAGITIDVTERVKAEEREQALQQQLRDSAHQAGMAEIATGVLHNVGNVLNSLGIANSTARRELKGLRLERLEQATALLASNRATLAAFLTEHERGRHLPEYLPALSAQIVANVRAIQTELETTEQLVHHLGDIVSAQQELARVGGQSEPIQLNELIDTALLVHASELTHIRVVREYDELPPIMTDRHKLLQIVVNLLSNARDAVQTIAAERARILVKLRLEGDHVQLTVEDTGIGMSEEVLSQLWRFGFTTKKKGHGFGLHNSANVAHEMGITLTAHSDGVGRGSRFVLRLPIHSPEPALAGEVA